MDNGNEDYHYNRIVIIGNGLDLALGLKTSYSDFLIDYFKSCVLMARKEVCNDLLFSLDNTSQEYYDIPLEEISTIDEWKDLTTRNKHWNYTYKGILSNIMEFQKIENWVDIESLYFDSLIPKIDYVKRNTSLARRNYSNVKTFNESFRRLTDLLEIYIKKINQISFQDTVYLKFYDFLRKIDIKQINANTCLNHPVEYKELNNPEKIMFLNFNYTDTVKKLFLGNGIRSHQTINIHGQAGRKSDPIIFGYGDDTHPYYAKMEEERSDVPLEFIKSFYYNRTTDYHDMLGFIESGPYEVYIVGHSCGLSDRTLLKSIFEHKECISIKIFHKGNKDKSINLDEHIRKNMAISRHFDNKQLLRKRVLPFDEHAGIPQVIK